MSTEAYASFLEHMGHRVRRVGGVYWYDASRRVYTSFPLQNAVDPRALDLRAVLGSDGLAARFPCPLEAGRPSHRFTCDATDYGMEHLSPRTRGQTRRGLERCSVRPVKLEELLSQGSCLERETLARQGRRVPAGNEEYWARYFRRAVETEGADIWGAFVGGSLAAYLVAFCMEGCASIVIVRSASRWLEHYPNNALLFTYMKEKLAEDAIREVSIGLESLQPGMETLERFKRHMGFRKVEIGQRIELAPWLRPLVRRPLAKALGRLIEPRVRGSELLGKLCGMLSWYGEQPSLRR